MKRICVMGLGYIGLPTASLFATHGHSVLGVDTSEKVVDTINAHEHFGRRGLSTVGAVELEKREGFFAGQLKGQITLLGASSVFTKTGASVPITMLLGVFAVLLIVLVTFVVALTALRKVLGMCFGVIAALLFVDLVGDISYLSFFGVIIEALFLAGCLVL